jgi:pimeloyl-ACP methyl ester carboxylesterase
VIEQLGEGFPVVCHHGSPSTAKLYSSWRTDGVRLIGFDRSGYRDAPRRHGRAVADVVDEVVAVVDSLGIERFATWGISGGGPHALACAALLPDRIVAAAAIGSPAPLEAEGLDWYAGFGEGNVIEFGAAEAGEVALRPMLEQGHAARSAGGVAALRDGLSTLLSGADAEMLDGPFVDYLYDLMTATGGVHGWVDDDLAFVRPWGFDLALISVPVLIRHGEQDRFVPPAHAHWLADHIPGSEAQITTGDGHLTLYEDGIAGVHSWVLRYVH